MPTEEDNSAFDSKNLASPQTSNDSQCHEDSQSSLKDEGETKESSKVYAWDALSTIASTITQQTRMAVGTYAEELGELLDNVGKEATHVFHAQQRVLHSGLSTVSHAASSLVHSLVDSYSTSTPGQERGSLLFDETFLQSYLETHVMWVEYCQSPAFQAQHSLTEAHRAAILANDSHLSHVYGEMVNGSEMVSKEQFWKAWLFWKYLVERREESDKRKGDSPTNDEIPITADDSSWDQDAPRQPSMGDGQISAISVDEQVDFSVLTAADSDDENAWD